MFRNVNIEKEFCTAAPIKGSFGQVKVKFLAGVATEHHFHLHFTAPETQNLLPCLKTNISVFLFLISMCLKISKNIWI